MDVIQLSHNSTDHCLINVTYFTFSQQILFPPPHQNKYNYLIQLTSYLVDTLVFLFQEKFAP